MCIIPSEVKATCPTPIHKLCQGRRVTGSSKLYWLCIIQMYLIYTSCTLILTISKWLLFNKKHTALKQLNLNLNSKTEIHKKKQ